MIGCSRRRVFGQFSQAFRPRHFSDKRDTLPYTTSGLPRPRLDYRQISENAAYKSQNALDRKACLPVAAIQTIKDSYIMQKELSSKLNAKRHERSLLGQLIRPRENEMPEQVEAILKARILKDEVSQLERRLADIEEKLFALALALPNDSHPESPIGPEEVAKTLSTHGPPTMPASDVRDHLVVGRALNLLDLDAGSTVTGSSWYYLLNEAALLEMALTNYALSIATRHGFSPVITPDVVRADVANRCGFQPRDQNADPPVSQMYHIAPAKSTSSDGPASPELVLSGTAEIPLAGMFANKIYSEAELPLKVVGLGRAFRAEAGARGTDTRGLYRVHQFTKLELFVVAPQEHSGAIMEDIRMIQTEIFEGLGLSFRVLDMPTEELGASAYRKYDIEAWMPGRGKWGEISSTSNCTDYQSRRLHIRYRKTISSDSSAPEGVRRSSHIAFTHTLNGTAAAIPRLIVALLENGAQFDEAGSIIGLDLPSALRRFWLDSGSQQDVIRWI